MREYDILFSILLKMFEVLVFREKKCGNGEVRWEELFVQLNFSKEYNQ